MRAIITRRRFLSALGSVGILAVLVRKPLAQVAPPTTAADTNPALLTSSELDVLTAFGRALVPSSFYSADAETATGADEIIRAILHNRSADPDFRDAAVLLDQTSARQYQMSFVALDFARQREIVHDLFEPYATRTFRSRAYYALTSDGRRVRHAWSSVAKAILTGFYESRLGWQVVGYAHPPGECSNLVDYQYPARING